MEGRRRHDDRRRLLFYPIDYEAGRRYPLVVQMHGGPADSDKFGAGPGLLLNYFPVLDRPRLRRAAAELPRQHRLRQRVLRDVVGGYFRNMHLDVHGRRGRAGQAAASPIPIGSR